MQCKIRLEQFIYKNSTYATPELGMSQYKSQSEKETDGIISKTHDGRVVHRFHGNLKQNMDRNVFATITGTR